MKRRLVIESVGCSWRSVSTLDPFADNFYFTVFS